jgi:hypothetical protein
MRTDGAAFEPFDLPAFEKPQIEWHPEVVVWERVIEETEPMRRYYLEHFDKPENRLRDKNPNPFRL